MTTNPLTTLWQTFVGGTTTDKTTVTTHAKKRFVAGKAYDATGNPLPNSAALGELPFVGEIMMFGGSYAPVNWQLCQGQLLPISGYELLFALIGTTYGGDGQSDFGLPDLSSRIPLHMDSSNPLGTKSGAEEVTLTVSNIAGMSQPVPQVKVGGTGTVMSGAISGRVEPGSVPIFINGGGLSHTNMPPYTVISFCIATEGIYPSP
jgi:microcystin-dependent protein